MKLFPVIVFLAAIFAIITPASAAENAGLRIVAWGENQNGQLGTGEAGGNAVIPVIAAKVEEILKPDFTIVQLAGSDWAFCLLRSDKTVWCWGDSFKPRADPAAFLPHKIQNLPPVKSLTGQGGEAMCATTEENHVWCWSGDEPPVSRYMPEWSRNPDLQALARSFISVSMSVQKACGLTGEGKVWCWNPAEENALPGLMKLPGPATEIHVGSMKYCAMLEGGVPWCWAYSGKSGIADEHRSARQALGGGLFTVLTAEGHVLHSDSDNGDDPLTAPGMGPVRKIALAGHNPSAIQGSFACALGEQGGVWCWSGTGFRQPRYPGDEKPVTQVKRPDAAGPLAGAVDIAVSGNSAIAVVKAAELGAMVPDTPSTAFFRLVIDGHYGRAREYHATAKPVLDRQSPLAQEALLRVSEFNQADLMKIIGDAGVTLPAGSNPDDVGPGEGAYLSTMFEGKPKTQIADRYRQRDNSIPYYRGEKRKRLIGIPEAEAAAAKAPEPVTPLQGAAYVVPCAALPDAAPRAQDYDVVFQGRRQSGGGNGDAVFDVATVFKGDTGTSIKILPVSGAINVAAGEEVVVFARRAKEQIPGKPSCTPVYSLAGGMPAGLASAIADMAMFNAKIKASGVFDEYHDDIAYYVQHPQEGERRQWQEAGKMLEEFGDHERAVKVYAAMLADDAAKAAGGNRKRMHHWERDVPEICGGIYAQSAAAPEFLKMNPRSETLFVYGRALYMAGRHADALRPLCLAQGGNYYKPDMKGPSSWRMMALLRLGMKTEVDSKQHDFSGAYLPHVDMSGLNIPFSKFTDAIFADADLSGAKLGGSDFENAIFAGGKLTGTDLRGANFKGARVDTKLDGAVLANALYDGRTTWPAGFDPKEAGMKLSEAPTAPPEKLPGLPADFAVEGFFTYEGKYPPGIRHSHSYTPTGRIDITVAKTDKPIVLVIGAHEPTDWHFTLQPGVRIAGVLVGGLYHQAAFGIPGDVPVIRAGSFYDRREEREIKQLNEALQKYIGRTDVHFNMGTEAEGIVIQ